MIEAIAAIGVFVFSIIFTVMGYLILRSIRAKDEKDREQDQRLNANEKSISDNTKRLEVFVARDELQLGPIMRDISEIKTNMVTQESFKNHQDQLTEFKTEFKEHTGAHVGIKEYVDQRFEKLLKELKKA